MLLQKARSSSASSLCPTGQCTATAHCAFTICTSAELLPAFSNCNCGWRTIRPGALKHCCDGVSRSNRPAAVKALPQCMLLLVVQLLLTVLLPGRSRNDRHASPHPGLLAEDLDLLQEVL